MSPPWGMNQGGDTGVGEMERNFRAGKIKDERGERKKKEKKEKKKMSVV